MTEIDIPEDFDLNRARARQSTTPTSERPRCPKCRHLSARKKTGKPTGRGTSDKDYWCNRCLHQFDDPLYFEDGDSE